MLRTLLSIVAFTLCVLVGSSRASGQATRPTDPVAPTPAVDEHPWPKLVEQFSKSLATGDRAAIDEVLNLRPMIRRFNATGGAEDTSTLLQRTAKATVIGQHAYLHPPLVMAADIAADFKNATAVPDKDKLRFLIDDDADMKRANATAVQWVTEQLGARQGTAIGVIILWTPRPAPAGAADSAAPTHDIIFVLCRGDEVAPKTYKLVHIVSGNPLGE